MRQVEKRLESVALRSFAASGAADDESDEDALEELEAHPFDGVGEDDVRCLLSVNLDQLLALLVVIDDRLRMLVECRQTSLMIVRVFVVDNV